MSRYIFVLGSSDRRVVLLLDTHVPGRKVDRRVLATDSDAELPVFGIGPARWPDGPTQSGVAQGFNLIPVSGVGEAVSDKKMRGSGGW